MADETGKVDGFKFQDLCMERMEALHSRGLVHAVKYGVQALRNGNDVITIASLPDFDTVIPPLARQAVYDAKVCSQASFALDKYRDETEGARRRQIKHLFLRADFGAAAFLLMHWNPRELRKTSFPAETYAVPVYRHIPFWDNFLVGEEKSLNRGHCEEFGVKVEWNYLDGERKARPDVLAAINGVFAILDDLRSIK